MKTASAPDRACPSEPFWTGLTQGAFMLQHDRTTGRFAFYPRATTGADGKPLSWRPASGRGTLAAVTVSRIPMPGFDAPRQFGLVRLDEGPHVFSVVVGCAIGKARIGMRVELVTAMGDGPEPFCFRVSKEQQ